MGHILLGSFTGSQKLLPDLHSSVIYKRHHSIPERGTPGWMEKSQKD